MNYLVDQIEFVSISFGHQLTPLALVPKLAIMWRHLQVLQIWPPGCVTCIVTLPWIAPLASSVSIELVSSQPESHQISLTKVSELETLGSIDRTPGIPGSDKNG